MEKICKYQFRKKIRITRQAAFILFVAAIVGTLLLYMSFLLPDSRIVSHAEASLETFNAEGTYPNLIDETKITRLDNFTDALMINTASYSSLSLSLSDSHEYSPLEQALLNPRAHYDGDQIETLNRLFSGETVTTVNYARYWHGYIAYLRPLLILFDYNLIRLVLVLFQLALGTWYLILLNKKCGKAATVSFVCVYAITGSFASPFSIQYSNVMLTTLVSGIVLLRFFTKIENNEWISYFFLITGVLTSYLDLLTFPIVTLGVNLCLYFLFDKKISIKKILLASFFWCLGYFGMWFSKWIIASVITGQNVIMDATAAAQFRASSLVNDEEVTYLNVVRVNFEHINDKYLILPFIVIMLFNTISAIKSQRRKINGGRFICLLFIFTIPFIWYYGLQNHSYIHNSFTFKTLSPALLAMLMLYRCLEAEEMRDETALPVPQ